MHCSERTASLTSPIPLTREPFRIGLKPGIRERMTLREQPSVRASEVLPAMLNESQYLPKTLIHAAAGTCGGLRAPRTVRTPSRPRKRSRIFPHAPTFSGKEVTCSRHVRALARSRFCSSSLRSLRERRRRDRSCPFRELLRNRRIPTSLHQCQMCARLCESHRVVVVRVALRCWSFALARR